METTNDLGDERMRWIDERRAALAAELAELDRREAAVERFGDDDDYEDGAIITFDRRWGSDGAPTYSYAALKAGELWYLTGRAQEGITFAALVARHLSRATRVDLVTDVEAL